MGQQILSEVAMCSFCRSISYSAALFDPGKITWEYVLQLLPYGGDDYDCRPRAFHHPVEVQRPLFKVDNDSIIDIKGQR